MTEALRVTGGSLGSRLHRGSDGIWYGYAQWPSEETRQYVEKLIALQDRLMEIERIVSAP